MVVIGRSMDTDTYAIFSFSGIGIASSVLSIRAFANGSVGDALLYAIKVLLKQPWSGSPGMARTCMRGFPKIRGTISGVPIIWIKIAFGGVYIGVPFFWETTMPFLSPCLGEGSA